MARKGRAVICLNSAQVYSSIKEAASDLRLDPAAVQRAAAGIRSRAGNYFFMYLDNMDQIPIDFKVWCEGELQNRLFWLEFGRSEKE